MAVQTPPMARKPERKPIDREKYRKEFKQARIRGRLAAAAMARADALEQDFTQYVNDALRMRLEAEGFWPPLKHV
jgi:hypothetical protein